MIIQLGLVRSSLLDIYIQPLDYVGDKAISPSVMETVQLHCLARGRNITYRWLHDNTAIRETGRVRIANGSLLVTSVSTSDQGRYQCIAEGREGISLSRFATLEILALPWMSSDSKPVIASEGNYSYLPCGIVSTTKPWPSIIYWTKKSTGQNPADGKRVFVSSATGNLYFSYVTKLDTDEYRCHIISEVFHQYLNISLKQESQSIWKILNVVGESNRSSFAARILSEGAHRVTTMKRIEGISTVVLDCIAVGRPLPLIYWDRSGGPLPFDRYNYENNGRRLILKTVTSKDSDRYRCHSRNVYGEDTVIYKLQVERRPQWISPVRDVFVAVQQSEFRWPCIASGSSITYLWFANGNEIKNNSKYSVFPNGNLVISSVTKDDSKIFTCIAKNNFDNIASYGRLNVISSSPKFISSVMAQTFFLHTTDILQCAVFGGPRPDMEYYRDTNYINTTNRKFEKYQNGNLKLHDVVLEDQGVYRCMARNSHGESSKLINVVVRNQTILSINSSKEVLIRRYYSFALTCSVTKDARLLMQLEWRKDDVNLSNCSGIIIYHISPLVSLLTVSNATFNYTGIYSCIVKLYDDRFLNKYIANKTKLIVVDIPDPVRNITYHELTAKSVFISWVPGSENFKPLIRFIVLYQVNNNTSFKVANPDISPNMNTAKLNLSPWNRYRITVVAENGVGRSKSNQIIELQTKGSVPIYLPNIVRATGSKSMPDVISVRWTPLPREYHCGPGIQYFLLHKERDNRGQKYTRIRLLSHYQTMIHGLRSNIIYEVRMQTKNYYGEGNMSTPIFVKTGLAPPGSAPDKIEVFQINETSVQIFWRKIASSIVNGYKVVYSLNDSDAVNVMRIGDVSSAVITGLLSNYVYTFNVNAYNNGGDGPQSEVVYITMTNLTPDLDVVPVFLLHLKLTVKYLSRELLPIFLSADEVSQTCQNHPCYRGYCRVRDDRYRCACSPGWIGQFCDTDVGLQPKPFLSPLTITSGQTPLFTCIINITAQTGVVSLPIQYTWYLDGSLLTNSDLICKSEKKQGVQWSATRATQTDLQMCPENFVGIAKRKCRRHRNAALWENPDLTECMTKQLYSLKATISSGFYDCGYLSRELPLVNSINGDMITGEIITIVSFLNVIARDCNDSVANKTLQDFALLVNSILNVTLKQQWQSISMTSNVSVVDVANAFKKIALRWQDPLTNSLSIKHSNIEIKLRVLPAGYNKSLVLSTSQTSRGDYTTAIFSEEMLKEIDNVRLCIAFMKYTTLAEFIPIAKSNSVLRYAKEVQSMSLDDMVSIGIGPINRFPVKVAIKIIFQHPKQRVLITGVRRDSMCVYWSHQPRSSILLNPGCQFAFSNASCTICNCMNYSNIGLLSLFVNEDNSSRITFQTTGFIYMSHGISLVCNTLTFGYYIYLIRIRGFCSRFLPIINLTAVSGFASLLFMIAESMARNVSKVKILAWIRTQYVYV
ncbi:uncharacterized protein TRIADDRAFT_59150 [Trichoplax adhaerens]|uniref:Uncharacterized protein n=1 Tax=Trichoplax adhaerens TaxID=10228 RepID=B3S4N4_TRIAD|nr:hypothetical protein TRIADDRAFT_59150 [Trichoplax adhaerens]EDV22498.1 hypothetical protein TRIADDRAFT_59150 [Trichoplax adhaerens]|eukprot:XP_002115042.1 hypothetical protein TRIADDRAFT_59150 [Trichoplax adhaerens]